MTYQLWYTRGVAWQGLRDPKWEIADPIRSVSQ
jgi:hypothetical protein